MTATPPVRAPRALAAVGSPAPETFQRYRPGTYSATVETIRLTNGRTVRTDLIRLHPNVECYSLDMDGAAPRLVAHYTATPWSSTVPALRCAPDDVATILRASYPAVGLSELSARVRDAGRPLGTGDLRPHEAIAATQAALWYLTNGVDLDTRPVAAPVAMTVRRHGHPEALPVPPGHPAWIGAVTRDRGVGVELTLADRIQVGSYFVRFAAGSELAGVRLSLERSPDGSAWTPVPSSTVTAADGTCVHKSLGVGATLADSRGRGYAHYRLVLTAETPFERRVGIEAVSLTPAGGPPYRNPDRVVHLYHYLLDQLHRQAAPGEPISVLLAGATVPARHSGAVAPIRVHGTAGRRFAVRALDRDAHVVDDGGNPVFGQVGSGETLFVQLPRRRSTPVVRVAVTERGARLEPQLLLGAPSPGAPPTFAPLVRLRQAEQETTSAFLLDVTRAPDRMEGVD